MVASQVVLWRRAESVPDDHPSVSRTTENQHAVVTDLTAVHGASVVLFLVDALAGVTPSDERLAPLMRRLHRRSGPPHLVLAVNKVDNHMTAGQLTVSKLHDSYGHLYLSKIDLACQLYGMTPGQLTQSNDSGYIPGSVN